MTILKNVVTDFYGEVFVGKEKNRRELPRRLLCTAWVLAVYIAGCQLMLFGLDHEAYGQTTWSAEYFLNMVIGGDLNRVSVFALGFSPMMIASILMMAVSAVRRAATRSRFSIKKMRRMQYGITFLIAVVQAAILVVGLQFAPSALPVAALRCIAAAELAAGAMLITLLGEYSQKHGLGGASVLILINLVSSLVKTAMDWPAQSLLWPAVCSALAAAATLWMENAEFRIPVQRISIQTIYRDKNYIAVKYNPVGVMPVMFTTAIFLFVQQLAGAAGLLLSLLRPAGIAAYIAVLFLFTIGLAMVTIDPANISEQLMKNNDSICGVCLGRSTKARLTRVVLGASLLSAAMMGLCIGTSLWLGMQGWVETELVMIPSTAMLLTGILVNLWRQLHTAITFDAYRPFL